MILDEMAASAIASDADIAEMERALKELEEKAKQERQQKLEGLSAMIARLRDQAVTARRNSGFEKQWLEDEEYYAGIDELSSSDNQLQYHKPGNNSDVLREKTKDISKNACTAFLNITAPFVDAAAARIADIILPANDWNFGLKATPIPEFEEHKEDDRPMLVDQTGAPLKTVAQAIQDNQKEAEKRVRKAEKRIQDWLIQCGYKEECRKVIDGFALTGTGILKGPYPKLAVSQVFDGQSLVINKSLDPSSCRVSHWDFFPDMNCGENIQDGDYVFERSFLYKRALEELKDQEGYIKEAIDKVLEEGPGKRNEKNTSGAHKPVLDDDRYEVWYCYKYMTPDDLRLFDSEFDQKCKCLEEEEQEVSMEPFMASLMMVNDTIIYATKWPIQHNGFPFDVLVWQRVPGQPFGIGVSRQGRTAQKTVLAAYRKLMENQGLAAKPMIAFIQEALEPVDKNWEIYGGKMWRIKINKGITDARQAIQAIELPSRQADLAALIQFGMKSMEDSTGITFLLQGQQGSAPDTVGGMQMMLQSSASLLRRVTRIYDAGTISHIKRYYSWLLIAGEEDEKGDYQIEARGSSALLEREIQSMQLPQLLQFAMNPSFELSPKKTIAEILKAWRFDPGKFELDEAEKQAAQNTQQPQDPRIVTEQIKSQTALKIAEQKTQVDMQRIQKDTDRDALYADGVSERNQMTYQAHIEELQLKRDLAMLEYANREKTNLDSIKAKLADSSMKLSVQKELASVDNAAPARQVITPPTEPPQRAQVGRAYQE